MFSHIVIGTQDIAAAKKFYDAALGAIGIAEGAINENGTRLYYRTPGGTLIITIPLNGEPASVANGSTIGFKCETTGQADAFHDSAVANGGTSVEDPPGWRESGGRKLYLAYVRDPAGNKLCAMNVG